MHRHDYYYSALAEGDDKDWSKNLRKSFIDYAYRFIMVTSPDKFVTEDPGLIRSNKVELKVPKRHKVVAEYPYP
jgi:hypothetical protein